MLALQGANNETGVVQPVAEAAALVHARGRDRRLRRACSSPGELRSTRRRSGADFLILSAHKFGGPEGRWAR